MDRGLPTGVVTFLFTDIEGSTRLLHELGAEYADALAVSVRSFAEHSGATAGLRSIPRATRS
jgi:class 3 adenylate cyclase